MNDDIQQILTLIRTRKKYGQTDEEIIDRLLEEKLELLAALKDRVSPIKILLEGADAAYHSLKYLDWVSRKTGVKVEDLFKAAAIKYQTRRENGKSHELEEFTVEKELKV